MKKLLIMLLLSKGVLGNAQTSAEWTQQKKTQKKYLLQQIAAFRVYIGYAKTGYDIASKGLTTVRNIKNGDFNLHRDFLGSFLRVNPKIKSYAKVADIIAYQIRIIKEAKEMMQGVREAGQFTSGEIDHCGMVIDNLLIESFKNLEELLLLITDGDLQMKDDERIKRIDALYADMQDKYSFTSSFSEEMALLTVQRMRELQEVDLSRKLNGFQ